VLVNVGTGVSVGEGVSDGTTGIIVAVGTGVDCPQADTITNKNKTSNVLIRFFILHLPLQRISYRKGNTNLPGTRYIIDVFHPAV
jgi:hypothetical protein